MIRCYFSPICSKIINDNENQRFFFQYSVSCEQHIQIIIYRVSTLSSRKHYREAMLQMVVYDDLTITWCKFSFLLGMKHTSVTMHLFFSFWAVKWTQILRCDIIIATSKDYKCHVRIKREKIRHFQSHSTNWIYNVITRNNEKKKMRILGFKSYTYPM